METTYESQAKIFKALCDEKRLRILELLRTGEKCACVLVEELDMPQSSLSYHMKILTESAIVACRKDGKWSHYKLSTKGAEQTKKLLSQLTTENDNAQESCTCSKDNILAATSYIQ